MERPPKKAQNFDKIARLVDALYREPTMQAIEHPTDLATIELREGESLLCAPGHLAWMSANVTVKTLLSLSHRPGRSVWGRFWDAFWGFWRNFVRKLRGKEPFLLHQYTPRRGAGRVVLAPPLDGEIHHYTLSRGESLRVAPGGFLACAPRVRLVPEGKGLSLLRVSGPGEVWLAGCGGVEPLSIHGGLLLQVEHVVALSPGLSYRLRPRKDNASPEVELFGQGEVWVQTRSPGGFSQKLLPRLAA